MKNLSCFIVLIVCCSPAVALAEGWGNLTGKLVVEGTLDVPEFTFKKGENVKDAAVCSVVDMPNESVVLGPNGELANAFVYLYSRRSTPDIHPDLKDSAEKEVVFDNQGCRFMPHVSVVRTDQKIRCINSDACGHNVHTFPLKNNAYNPLISANDKSGLLMEHEQAELLPMQVKCDIHPWMTAYWLIVEHPYATVSAADGTFTIKNLPAGEHTFRIWQEKVGYIEKGKDVEIQAGQTVDLGVIKVPAKDFEE